MVGALALTAAVAQLRQAPPAGVPDASLAGVEFHAFEAERWRHEDRTYVAWMERAGGEMATEALAGRDPYASRRGMMHRAMRSPLAPGQLRPYGLYVPRSYDPARLWPLLVLLHGAGSDYMATLRLGMGMTRAPGESKALSARRIPHPAGLPDLPALVATPSGYGNTDFRYAGETEVLEVVDDVVRHYAVDPDRIWLAGISRGGWGAMQLGVRHAGRFAAVADVCGFVDPFVQRPRTSGRWGQPLRGYETAMLRLVRPIDNVERFRGTEVVLVHGGRDPGTALDGPQRLARRLAEDGQRPRVLVYPGGFHHVWMPTLRDGTLVRMLENVRREARPARVTLLAGGYRDGESRWLRVEQIARFGRPVRIDARAAGGSVDVATENVERFSLALGGAPVDGEVAVVVDGAVAWRGEPPERLVLARGPGDARWAEWDGTSPEPGTRKVRGLSGPVHDAWFERTVHVYGTGRSGAESHLRKAARRGARLGYLGNGNWIDNPIVRDRDFRPEAFRGLHVALYGDAGTNVVVREIGARLPIAVGDGFVSVRGRRLGRGHGVRMIHPSPFDPSTYLTVVAAPDPRDVERAMGLPELLPDYLVWDRTTMRGRWAYVLRPAAGIVEAGFFDDTWRLRPESDLVRTAGREGWEATP